MSVNLWIILEGASSAGVETNDMIPGWFGQYCSRIECIES